MSLVEWTVTSNPPPPTLRAIIKHDSWNMTTETMREISNLTVLEHSFLMLICIAGYPVLWSNDSYQPLTTQSRTYNPYLEGQRVSYGLNHKNYSVNDNLSIPAIDQYESRITFQNISKLRAAKYKCLAADSASGLETVLNLYVRKMDITPDTAQLLQAGFSATRPPATWSSRYFTRQMQINSFIYTVPRNTEINQSCINPENQSFYNYYENDTISYDDAVLLRVTKLSDHIWQTTIILNRGTFYDNGYYHFVIKNTNDVILIDEMFNFDANVGSENLKDVTRVDPFSTITVLAVKKYYEIRMYLLSESTNISLSVTEQALSDSSGCTETKVLPFLAKQTCGILGVSLFNDSSLERGMRVFINVMGPCVLTAKVHDPREDLPPLKFYVTGVDPEVLGSDLDGVFISDPPEIMQQRLPMYVNESVTFRCLVPACSLSRISLEKNLYFSWAPFKNNDLRYVWLVNDHPVTVSKYDPNPSAYSQGYRTCTLAYDWTFENLTLNDTGDYACILFMPSSATGTRSIKLPEPPFHLQVRMPKAPSFDDGRDNYVVQVPLKSGSKTVLSCNVQGDPKPDIEWILPETVQNALLPRVIDQTANTTMEISDTGTYVCNVMNKFGNNSRTFNVVNEKEVDLRWAIAVPSVIIALVLLALIYWWLRRKSMHASFNELARLLKNPQYEVPIDDSAPLNDQVKFLPYNRKYELSRDSFTLTTKLLGSGEFGSVFKGELKIGENVRLVAVKVPKDLSNLQLHQILIDELKVMSHIRPHVNVLELVGACTCDIEKRQLFVLTEYCGNGSLSDYLTKNYMKFEGFAVNDVGQFVGTPGSIEALLKYCYQAANGMEHLAAEKIIHRDLALRNLLLTANHIVKIADFGMSRHDTSVYRKRLSPDVPVPIFWMALESLLNGQYTQKSDVWSFGVVLWEIFSCARRPYPDHSPDAEFRFWLCQNENNRLGVPTIACDEMYQLMRKCWKKDPDERPTFSQCKRFISQTLEQRAPAMYQSILSSLSDAWRNISNPSDAVSVNAQDSMTYSKSLSSGTSGISSLQSSEVNYTEVQPYANGQFTPTNSQTSTPKSNSLYIDGVLELDKIKGSNIVLNQEPNAYVTGSTVL